MEQREGPTAPARVATSPGTGSALVVGAGGGARLAGSAHSARLAVGDLLLFRMVPRQRRGRAPAVEVPLAPVLQRYVEAVEPRRDLDWLPARLALRGAAVPGLPPPPNGPPPKPRHPLHMDFLKAGELVCGTQTHCFRRLQ